MKVYTRVGDKGETALFDGTRVPKSNVRVDAYGTVDELNSCVSLARATIRKPRVRAVLERVQHELFVLGADLATPQASGKKVPRMTSEHVAAIEKDTDGFFNETGNPGFVLPGETEAGARLHVCRTVARRAERLTVALNQATAINPEAIRYLNRLSSLFYALAVWSDKIVGKKTLKNPKYS